MYNYPNLLNGILLTMAREHAPRPIFEDVIQIVWKVAHYQAPEIALAIITYGDELLIREVLDRIFNDYLSGKDLDTHVDYALEWLNADTRATYGVAKLL